MVILVLPLFPLDTFPPVFTVPLTLLVIVALLVVVTFVVDALATEALLVDPEPFSLTVTF